MKLRDALKDERGTVESGLTLIPLTILFLLTSQLIFLAQWGNWQRSTHQSSADSIAISGAESFATRSGDEVRYEPLIGGGYLVLSKRTTTIPLIAGFSILGSRGRDATSSSGLGPGSSATSAGPRFSDVVSSLSEVHTR